MLLFHLWLMLYTCIGINYESLLPAWCSAGPESQIFLVEILKYQHGRVISTQRFHSFILYVRDGTVNGPLQRGYMLVGSFATVPI